MTLLGGFIMNRLFSFDEKLKKEYHKDNYDNDLNYIRIMLVLCVFFYSIFGILDFVVDIPYRPQFSIIRFGIVDPIFILALALSFLPNFEKIHQMVLFIAYVSAGLGIVAMLVLVPSNFSYYGGLFLIFAVGHFMTTLYWTHSTIASSIIFLSYLFISLGYGSIMKEVFIYSFFYVFFIVICVYASYVSEQYRRGKFSQTQNLEGDKIVLEKEIYTKLLDIENANRITIFSLARLSESRDHFTGDHIERVGTLCLQVAEVLPDRIYEHNQINKGTFLAAIELASTLHDIGKVAIPESILMKPGPLTAEEMVVMHHHTIYGYETLMKIRKRYEKNDFINMGIDICKYHHERWNGEGYPVGLAKEQIPLSARIVSVVDVFDALISERPYKKPYSVSYALEVIENDSGSMFDPEVVTAFLSLDHRNNIPIIKHD